MRTVSIYLLAIHLAVAAGSVAWKDKLYQPITAVDLEASRVRGLLSESGRLSPNLVMDYLSRTKDKNATLIKLWIAGKSFTFNDLLKLNEAKLESCSLDALKERLGVCSQLRAAQVGQDEAKIRLNLIFLCRRSLEDLAEICAFRGGNERPKFMRDLSEKWKSFVQQARRAKPRMSEDLYIDKPTEFERFIQQYQP